MLHFHEFDGLVQECSNSIANALELLQSCTKAIDLICQYEKQNTTSTKATDM